MNHDCGRTFRIIRDVLTNELGYHVDFRVIDAKSFVPQHRERILIVGFAEETDFSFDTLKLPGSARGSEASARSFTPPTVSKRRRSITRLARTARYLTNTRSQIISGPTYRITPKNIAWRAMDSASDCSGRTTSPARFRRATTKMARKFSFASAQTATPAYAKRIARLIGSTLRAKAILSSRFPTRRPTSSSEIRSRFQRSPLYLGTWSRTFARPSSRKSRHPRQHLRAGQPLPDVVDSATRSRMMAGICAKNTRPELILRSGLHRAGLRFKLHDRTLPGKPDLVFPRRHAVLFAHGCFWHGHDCSLFKWPKSREEFWRAKIERNREVDARVAHSLLTAGWRRGVVWECALKGRARWSVDDVITQCAAWLRSDAPSIEIRGRV